MSLMDEIIGGGGVARDPLFPHAPVGWTPELAIESARREGLEVLYRAGIRGDDLEDLPGLHVVERLLRLQNGKRAVEPAGIEFFIEVHVGVQASM